jgi:hypothetical protein
VLDSRCVTKWQWMMVMIFCADSAIMAEDTCPRAIMRASDILAGVENAQSKIFAFHVTYEAELPGSLPGEFLIHATGVWPLDERPAPQMEGCPLVLRDIVKSKQPSFVRKQQEQRDGVWCHVVEFPGRQCLWIDTRRSFTLIARETRDIQSGHLVERIQLGGHREVKPGVWFPAWIQNTQFDHLAKTPEGRQRKVIDSTIKLLDVRVNEDVSPRVFQFVPSPGALWLDPPDGRPAQTSPDGEELLDHYVGWSRRSGRYEKPSLTVRSKLLPFGAVLVLLAGAETLSWTLRKRRHDTVR